MTPLFLALRSFTAVGGAWGYQREAQTVGEGRGHPDAGSNQPCLSYSLLVAPSLDPMMHSSTSRYSLNYLVNNL